MTRILLVTMVMAGWWSVPAYGCIISWHDRRAVRDPIDKLLFRPSKKFSQTKLHSDTGSWSDSNGKQGTFASVLHTVTEVSSSGCRLTYHKRNYRYILFLNDGRKLEFSWKVNNVADRRLQAIGEVDGGEFVFSGGDDISMSVSVVELGKLEIERNGRRYFYPKIRFVIAIRMSDYDLNLKTDVQRGGVSYARSSPLIHLPIVEELEGKVKIDRFVHHKKEAKAKWWSAYKRAFSSVGCIRAGCAGIKDDDNSETSQ